MIFREVEDRDLIAQACRGEVEAYNILVSRWEKRVFNYLLRLVGHRDSAFGEFPIVESVLLPGGGEQPYGAVFLGEYGTVRFRRLRQLPTW